MVAAGRVVVVAVVVAIDSNMKLQEYTRIKTRENKIWSDELFWEGIFLKRYKSARYNNILRRTKAIDRKINFLNEIRGNVNKNSTLLDIGTGDGKLLLSLAGDIKKGVGIDFSEKIIEIANENLTKMEIKNVEFVVADARHLPFKNETFDVVIGRYSPITINEKFLEETKRVLKHKGKLFEYTVGEREWCEIKNVFGIVYKGEKFSNLKREILEKFGFSDIHIVEDVFFTCIRNIEDLVFLLETRPIIPYFSIEKDIGDVEKIKECLFKQGELKVTSHGIYISAKKC